MAEIDISVIVPCYNEEYNIDQSLQHLVKQETRYSYEIVVTDSSNCGFCFVE